MQKGAGLCTVQLGSSQQALEGIDSDTRGTKDLLLTDRADEPALLAYRTISSTTSCLNVWSCI